MESLAQFNFLPRKWVDIPSAHISLAKASHMAMPTASGAEKHNLGSGRGREYFDSIKPSDAEALLSSAHTLSRG